jgi:myosin heavy subunit
MVGATVTDLESLGLAVNGKKISMETFEYLKKSKCYEVKNIKDEELYHEVKASFSTMKFAETEEKAVWSIVSAVLNLGNVDFDDASFDNGSFLKFYKISCERKKIFIIFPKKKKFFRQALPN